MTHLAACRNLLALFVIVAFCAAELAKCMHVHSTMSTTKVSGKVLKSFAIALCISHSTIQLVPEHQTHPATRQMWPISTVSYQTSLRVCGVQMACSVYAVMRIVSVSILMLPSDATLTTLLGLCDCADCHPWLCAKDGQHALWYQSCAQICTTASKLDCHS